MSGSFMEQITTDATASNRTSFTCNACALTFPSSDIQRFHMKSDWHRYNLKRKLEGLMPVSSEEFQVKIERFNKIKESGILDDYEYSTDEHNDSNIFKSKDLSKTEETSDIADYEESSEEKEDSDADMSVEDEQADDKQLFNINKLNINKKSVNDNMSDTDGTEFYKTTDFNATTASDYTSRDPTTDGDSEMSLDSDEDGEPDELSVNDCVFCYHTSKDSERNIKHMFTKHGFYIPERSFLVDLNGLLSFIDYIINCEEHCLVCEYQGSGIKHHLEKKGHARMVYETAKQKSLFKDYYDFSTASEVDFKINKTPHEVKSIKFAVEETKAPKKISDEERKLKEKEQALKNQRQQRVAVAIGNYKKNDKMYPGVSAKQSENLVKQIRKMEMRYHKKQNNRRAFQQANFQKHFRDELLQ
ncbi:hypothetical protein ACO0R3_001730 [Hanseniaspora guilliermondii]